MAEVTPEKLDEIEQRAKAATPGPWESGEWVRIKARFVSEICAAEGIVVVADTDKTALAVDDMAFVAAAREDVPALLAEVRRLRDLCEEHRIDPAKSPCPRCSSCGARALVVWVLSADWLAPSPPLGDATGAWVCDRELRVCERAALSRGQSGPTNEAAP